MLALTSTQSSTPRDLHGLGEARGLLSTLFPVAPLAILSTLLLPVAHLAVLPTTRLLRPPQPTEESHDAAQEAPPDEKQGADEPVSL